ncbi:MAG: polysaccharide deacetylase family protein [Thermoanaerobaculia bacterium]|nr:polysaccharide deacetylase family protein [Thermoanaerobaculia bacterium]
MTQHTREHRSILGDQLRGAALFLFIPVVLFLFVAQPEPVGLSLTVGIVLMLGHRFLARPYMRRVATRRCLWTGATLSGHEVEPLDLGGQPARIRSRHACDLRRFFTFVYRRRLPLRVGIFLPLSVLLGTLTAAAIGRATATTLATATDVFRLVIGLTVNFAAWGWLTIRAPDEEIRVPFPIHNFFLLGVRALLWIFRLVGIWWIFVGAAGLWAVLTPTPAQGEASAQIDRRMVLTLDDLPSQPSQVHHEERMERITRDLVGFLQQQEIPAIGFVNESKLIVEGKISPNRVQMLEAWLSAGLELGNHTYSHPNLHGDVSLDEYQQDILQGERVLRPMMAKYDQTPRFFRHPFLRTGLDLATRDAVHEFLAGHGYRVAPVTVDNSEWIYARAYDRALEGDDADLVTRLGRSYVDYMVRMVAYYEDQSRQLFEREIPQILLLHANALNADHLPPLVEQLESRGYRFIELDEALGDPAFDSPDRYTGRGGITWIHRWAITRGVDPSMFHGEPATPDWVQDVAGIRE